MSTIEEADRCTLCGARDSEQPGACLALQRSEREGTGLPCPATPEAEMYEGTDALDVLGLCPAGKLWPAALLEKNRRAQRRLAQGSMVEGQGARRPKEDAWIQTASGLAFKPWAPEASMVTIEDVAHALSHLCRFNGHSRWAFSVAQHSVLGSDAMANLHIEGCRVDGSGLDRERLALLFLLHDAAEAYVGDVVSPIKRHAGGFFADLEERVAKVIYEALDVQPPSEEEQKVVTEVDLRMLATEKRDLHHEAPQSWELDHAPFDFHLHYLPPTVVRSMFLERYRALKEAVSR